jgi:hypothetical protein
VKELPSQCPIKSVCPILQRITQEINGMSEVGQYREMKKDLPDIPTLVENHIISLVNCMRDNKENCVMGTDIPNEYSEALENVRLRFQATKN